MQVSIDELDGFAEAFWNYVKAATVFAFHGPMGAGKTTIIKSLCRYKRVSSVVSSPTYAVINEYYVEEKGTEQTIFHIDLYRLKDTEEIIQAGVEDCIESGAVCFVEWPQKGLFLFDEKTIHLLIEPVNATTRKVTVLTAAQFLNFAVTEQL